jgi:prepilin-type N-terminal cleavage/methylation domain-containing protein
MSNPRRSGFTLIELAVVASLLVILLFFALVSSQAGRRASNETSAVAALRNIAAAEAAWRADDADGNGSKDFWTLDWSGLNRVNLADGTPAGYIDARLAQADGAPAEARDQRPVISAPASGGAVPWSGYFFRAMTADNASPAGPYQLDLNGDSLASEHSERYGFTAYPAEPGSSGERIFVVTETHEIWALESRTRGPGGVAPAGAAVSGSAAGGQLRWPGPPGSTDLKGTDWIPIR